MECASAAQQGLSVEVNAIAMGFEAMTDRFKALEMAPSSAAAPARLPSLFQQFTSGSTSGAGGGGGGFSF